MNRRRELEQQPELTPEVGTDENFKAALETCISSFSAGATSIARELGRLSKRVSDHVTNRSKHEDSSYDFATCHRALTFLEGHQSDPALAPSSVEIALMTSMLKAVIDKEDKTTASSKKVVDVRDDVTQVTEGNLHLG